MVLAQTTLSDVLTFITTLLCALSLVACLVLAVFVAVRYAGPLGPDAKPWISLLTRDWLKNSVIFRGHRYPISRADYKVKSWLQSLIAKRRIALLIRQRPIRLSSLIPEFRTIVAREPIGGLVWCVTAKDTELREIAVWLLGRCEARGGRITAGFRHHPSARMRRHVVRALWRDGARDELLQLAEDDPDTRIRVMASTLVGRAAGYSDRLHRFLRHAAADLPTERLTGSHMPLYLLRPLGPGKPARANIFIRYLLEHIRNLVRGRDKNGNSPPRNDEALSNTTT